MSDTKAEASRRDQSAIAVDGLNDHNVLNNVNDAKTSICICTDVPQIFYALSTLVVAELDYGAKVSQRSEENLEKLYRLVDIVQLIPFDIECSKIFGTIKSKLRSLGKPTGEVDALIAATAMAHEAILVTANKKHFENIAGLKVEVWPIGSEV